jgi:hypothetical protein
MNRSEFSDSFDTLLNSYALRADFGEQSSKQEIVLDEYEKSVLLTQAQDIVVKSFFDRKSNSLGDGFDDSTMRQIDFSSLITTATLTKSPDQSTVFDDRGIIYTMPLRGSISTGNNTFDSTFDYTFFSSVQNGNITDVLFILNEKLVTHSGEFKKSYVVVPINYKEYDRLMSKPYSQPMKKQAWRLLQNDTRGFDIKSELIPRWNLSSKEEILQYKIRYIRRPYPIILEDLSDGLNIDGFSKARDCELNPILHPEILQRAVELAITTRGGRVPSNASNNNNQ